MCDHKLIPIGTIGVDTGRLLIIDPAHLDRDETRTLLRQLTSAAGLDSGGPARQLHFSHGHARAAMPLQWPARVVKAIPLSQFSPTVRPEAFALENP